MRCQSRQGFYRAPGRSYKTTPRPVTLMFRWRGCSGSCWRLRPSHAPSRSSPVGTPHGPCCRTALQQTPAASSSSCLARSRVRASTRRRGRRARRAPTRRVGPGDPESCDSRRGLKFGRRSADSRVDARLLGSAEELRDGAGPRSSFVVFMLVITFFLWRRLG